MSRSESIQVLAEPAQRYVEGGVAHAREFVRDDVVVRKEDGGAPMQSSPDAINSDPDSQVFQTMLQGRANVWHLGLA